MYTHKAMHGINYSFRAGSIPASAEWTRRVDQVARLAAFAHRVGESQRYVELGLRVAHRCGHLCRIMLAAHRTIQELAVEGGGEGELWHVELNNALLVLSNQRDFTHGLVGFDFGGDYLLADPTIAQYGLIADISEDAADSCFTQGLQVAGLRQLRDTHLLLLRLGKREQRTRERTSLMQDTYGRNSISLFPFAADRPVAGMRGNYAELVLRHFQSAQVVP